MRHILANLAVYALASGLVIGSLLFAWVRQAQIVVATERTIEPPEYRHATDPADFPWAHVGERVYAANCQNCHGALGQGRDVYPPVRMQGDVLVAEGGRDYLARLVIYGVYTTQYGAPMPAMPNLSDVQIAAVNNFILTRYDDLPSRYPDVRLFIPTDVAALRGEARTEREIGRLRPDVPPAHELARLEGR